jgi:hypothetical protein
MPPAHLQHGLSGVCRRGGRRRCRRLLLVRIVPVPLLLLVVSLPLRILRLLLLVPLMRGSRRCICS